MTEVLIEYGLFLAKAITIVVAVLVVVGGVAASSMASKSGRKNEEQPDVKVVNLNERYEDMEETLKASVIDKEELKALAKSEKKKAKAEKKAAKERAKKSQDSDADAERKKRIYVLDFDGDVHASQVEGLRQVVSAVLTMATKEDEIVLRLESPGGQVHGYGLASSQLVRIVDAEIPFTICVDKVAASGGYMMACTAQKILAAPFAILGSVGVVAELPNFNRALKKYDVDYNVYTAGEYKRTVTVMGENTEEGERKFKEELEETHQLFKQHVGKYRPSLDVDKIATGEHWYGSQALDLGLIDEIATSDEYLFKQRNDAKLYSISLEHKRTLADRLGLDLKAFEASVERVLGRLLQRFSSSQNRL